MKDKEEYKGFYLQENNDDIQLYEYGAHFSYKALYKRLEDIIKANNNNKKDNSEKESYVRLFINLKKANSQKILRNKEKVVVRTNNSRNKKINKNNHKNNMFKGKLNKSRSINKCLNFNKSFSEEPFGVYPIYIKRSKMINIKKEKMIINNKKSIKNVNKNNHTVLKHQAMISKKTANRNEVNNDYYEISPIKKRLDKSTNYESSKNKSMNLILKDKKYDISTYIVHKKESSSEKNKNQNKRMKISRIINKGFIKEVSSESPINNSANIKNNNSIYYSHRRDSDNDGFNYSSCSNKKQKYSCLNNLYNNRINIIQPSITSLSKNKIKDNIHINENYYIKSNITQRDMDDRNNFYLSNNNGQNKKMTLFDNFHHIILREKKTMKYINNIKNIGIFSHNIQKSNHSNRSSVSNKKKPSKSKKRYGESKKCNKTVLLMNKKTNNMKDINKKSLRKNNSSLGDISIDIQKKNEKLNNKANKGNNIDSIAILIDNKKSKSAFNKKSRNKIENIFVNCKFSITINSPINIVNNFQTYLTTTFTNKRPKIINSSIGINKIKKISIKKIKDINKKNNCLKEKKESKNCKMIPNKKVNNKKINNIKVSNNISKPKNISKNTNKERFNSSKKSNTIFCCKKNKRTIVQMNSKNKIYK